MAPPLSFRRLDEQPITNDPVFHLKSPCPNSTAGTAPTSYPVSVSDLFPSNTDSAATASPNPDHNGSPDHKSPESRDFKLLGLIAAFFECITILFGVTILDLIPRSPDVVLVSTSIAVHNVSNGYVIGDLDVGFIIENRDQNGMIYKDFSLLALNNHDHDHDHNQDLQDHHLSAAATIAPFEQDGYDESTVWFSLHDIRVPISDVIASAARVPVGYELSARVSYEGRTWRKLDTSMKAHCGKLKIDFQVNNDNATETAKLSQKLHSRNCIVDGWDSLRKWIKFGYIFGSAILVFFLLVFSPF